jgi:peptide/nickel transport system substrate-binding protein
MKSAVFVLLVLTGLLGACHDQAPGALRFGLQSAPLTLDPRYASDATSARIDRLLYRRLVEFDDQARPIPGIARWKQLSPTHYRFMLGSDGRRFHDGTWLTAADVKASYDFILDPANASPHRSALTVIARIETPDPDTVDFYLNRPDALFPGYLVIGIVPARLIASGHAFEHAPIGSGPCALLDWPEEGRLRLRRLSDGVIIEFVRVADPTVRVLKLLRGEIDMLQNDLPPELVRFLAQRRGIAMQQRRGSNFAYLGFNLRDPALAQPGVRQAIAQAIDRTAIIHYLFNDAARPADALLPPEHWAGNTQLAAYRYDPPRARVLLAAAGYSRQHPLRLTYKISNDPFRLRLATVLQSQLTAVGIDVRLQSYDWGTFYGDIKAGRFQLYSLSWVGIQTPDIFRYAYHSHSIPPDGANRGHYSDTRTDRLIEQAETAADPAEQARLYRALQARLLATLPVVPLWYEDQVFAARTDIAGYALSVNGDYDGLLKTRRK